MFPLIAAVWLILLFGMFFCLIDYISKESRIRVVLGPRERRILVGLWWVISLLLVSPVVTVFVVDFNNGGDAWKLHVTVFGFLMVPLFVHIYRVLRGRLIKA